MDVLPPETFGSLPPAAWPVEAIALVAMTPQDWTTTILAVLGASSITLGAVGKWLWGKWEESNLKRLVGSQKETANARKELAEEKVDRKACEDEREAERAYWIKTIDRLKADNEALQAVVTGLRAELAAAYRTISDRDAEIRNRDRSIDQNTRKIDRLSEDLARAMEAFLIKEGVMKMKEEK